MREGHRAGVVVHGIDEHEVGCGRRERKDGRRIGEQRMRDVRRGFHGSQDGEHLYDLDGHGSVEPARGVDRRPAVAAHLRGDHTKWMLCG